jgi:hypothetical protein
MEVTMSVAVISAEQKIDSPHRERSGHLVAAGLTAAGALLTVIGVCVPWVTYYGGLFALSAVGTTNGTRFLVAAGAAVALALGLAFRARPLFFVAAGVLGGIELAFSVYLTVQLRSALSGADAMAVARQGAGLYLTMAGGALMFVTVFLPQLRSADPLRRAGSEATAPFPLHTWSGRVVDWARSLEPRRALQLALGALWVLDAALQAQPYMFSRSFATSTLMGTAAGSPHVLVAGTDVMARMVAAHPVFANELFAGFQLLIGVLILRPRTVKLGLVASATWGLGVWILGESYGQIFAPHTTLFSGSPGAAIVYSLVSVLVWPRADSASDRASGSVGEAKPATGGSVAEASPLGRQGARAVWIALFALITFESWPLASTARYLSTMLRSMGSGEPGWLAGIDDRAASLFAHHGLEALATITVLLALCGAAVLTRRWRRPAIFVLLGLAATLWLVQDFGGIATGTATDLNSAPLLALLGLCFWPSVVRPSRPTACIAPARAALSR